MFFSIVLNKDIGCEKICNGIQKLIQSYSLQHSDLADSVLTIEIRPTTDSRSHIEPLKIEHKQMDS